MAKRIRTGLLEEQLITLHFAAPTTPEETEALEVLKKANDATYGKTIERTKLITEWYLSRKFTELSKDFVDEILTNDTGVFLEIINPPP